MPEALYLLTMDATSTDYAFNSETATIAVYHIKWFVCTNIFAVHKIVNVFENILLVDWQMFLVVFALNLFTLTTRSLDATLSVDKMISNASSMALQFFHIKCENDAFQRKFIMPNKRK